MSFQHPLEMYPDSGEKVEEQKMSPSTALGTWIIVFGMAVLFTVVLGAILAVPVMLLWNAALTDVFNLKKIGYIKAYELLLLARLLFAPAINYKRGK
jgi:multisubunit Na+/H+ antiporter MnhE subunit